MFEMEAGDQTLQISGRGECGGMEGMKVDRRFREGGTFWMMVGPLGVLFGEASTDKPKEAMGEFSVGSVGLSFGDNYKHPTKN